MSLDVLLFGGTFNPIHHGHLIVVRAVAERLGIGRVVLIPSANPPHKLGVQMPDAVDRLAMAHLAVEGEPGLEVSRVEIDRQGPSYTILTVEHFRQQIPPGSTVHWLIGADTLPELHTWYRVVELVEMCRIVTAARPGFEMPDLSLLRERVGERRVSRLIADVLDTPRIDISATQIRKRIADGASIRYLLPDSVRRYIAEHRLYQ